MESNVQANGPSAYPAGTGAKDAYDGNGKPSHTRWPDGWEEWNDYDDKGNKIHIRWSDGTELWRKWIGTGDKKYECYVDKDGNPV